MEEQRWSHEDKFQWDGDIFQCGERPYRTKNQSYKVNWAKPKISPEFLIFRKLMFTCYIFNDIWLFNT